MGKIHCLKDFSRLMFILLECRKDTIMRNLFIRYCLPRITYGLFRIERNSRESTNLSKANEESSFCLSSKRCSPHTKRKDKCSIYTNTTNLQHFIQKVDKSKRIHFKCGFTLNKNGNCGRFVINILITKKENQHCLEKFDNI